MAGFPKACIVATLGVCVSAMAVEIPMDSGRVPIWPELRIVAPADRNASPEQAAKLAGGSRALGVDSPRPGPRTRDAALLGSIFASKPGALRADANAGAGGDYAVRHAVVRAR